MAFLLHGHGPNVVAGTSSAEAAVKLCSSHICGTSLRQVVKAEVKHPDMPRGLGCLGSPEGQDGRYQTPAASELQRLMWTKRATNSHLDEVQPRIYIGDM